MSADVWAPKTETLRLEVAFAPARSIVERAVRWVLRVLRAQRPGVVEITVREAPLEHLLGYIDMATRRAKIVTADRTAVDDVFASLQDVWAASREHSALTVEMLEHVTGIRDHPFLAALTVGQREAILAAYEACHPALTEYKKKLAELEVIMLQRMAMQAATATLMIPTAGPRSSTGSEPDTGSTRP